MRRRGTCISRSTNLSISDFRAVLRRARSWQLQRGITDLPDALREFPAAPLRALRPPCPQRPVAGRVELGELGVDLDVFAGLSEELSRAEERLSRSQITRETVEAVLAAPSSPVPGADGAGGDAGGGVAAALVKAEAELDVTAMSPEYRAIIGLFATSEAAMRCKEVCRHLGLGTEPRHVEGMRSKLKRLVERGILAEPSFGLFKVDGRGQGW
ncbi:hypothetical protein J7I98_22475 [Streptomyces sp. ISL-98]|uniref:hypothetical protein n=1 Tax=Streptomyces sp. ISL-98 TaxID=2819192 RepID=UPI001BEB632D|nr:hypothetical protein [Streptomyces sp. ISL-98]MBT2508601.1 hypothetical protein [Streptomyces sp. ISL-98]